MEMIIREVDFYLIIGLSLILTYIVIGLIDYVRIKNNDK